MPEEPQSHESDEDLSDKSYDSDIQESFTDSDVGEEGLEYLKDDLNSMENGKFKLRDFTRGPRNSIWFGLGSSAYAVF